MINELLGLYNELTAAHRDLAKKTAELEALDVAKNQLIGVVAHELRNPIAIIRTYAVLLMEEAGSTLSPEQAESLRIIEQQAAFLLRMAGDLLDFSALEAGKIELRREPSDLSLLVEQVVRRNRLLAEPKRISLPFAAEPWDNPVTVDRQRIEQVLNNLIGNAVKFSLPGSTVRTELSYSAGEAVVSIRDSGPGIPQQEIRSLFEPFRRTTVSAVSGEPGTGLGLAISRKIIEAHGGRIGVESSPGQGSQFWFSLPTDAGPGPEESCVHSRAGL